MARFTKTWFIRNNAATYEAWQDDETAASFSSANLVAGVLDNITASDTLILFDAATFTLEATWNVDVSDIAIIGAGSAVVTNPAISEGTTVLNYTPATGDAITFDRAAGTRLANIQLSGFNLKTTTSTTSIGMRLEGVAGMELGNLSIAGFDGGGIYSEGMWDSVIRHCRIDNCGAAAGAAGATFYSSTAHASFNGTRLVDCTFESCPGPDLVIDDNGSGARPNKINISRCKFETLGNFQDHRIQIADVDFLTWVESNIFTGDSLVGGTPIDQMRLTNVVGSHIKGSRFESSGTVVSIDSFRPARRLQRCRPRLALLPHRRRARPRHRLHPMGQLERPHIARTVRCPLGRWRHPIQHTNPLRCTNQLRSPIHHHRPRSVDRYHSPPPRIPRIHQRRLVGWDSRHHPSRQRRSQRAGLHPSP